VFFCKQKTTWFKKRQKGFSVKSYSVKTFFCPDESPNILTHVNTIYLIPSAVRISVRRLLLFRSETERECKLIRHPRPSAFPRSIEFLSAVTTVGLGLLAGTNSNHRCVCSPAADTIVRAAHLSAPPAQVGYWRTGRVTPRAINFHISKMTIWEPER